MRIITLLTDFGEVDTYVAQMKGVILGICKDAKIIDISHGISPQNIEEGAFLLMNTVPFFPRGSIHIGVVDPGVGTERRGIVIDSKDFMLVGPDNGLLVPSASKDFRVFEITNKRYMLPSKTYTFHGRDIFAPIAAHLAKGVDIEEIGEEIDDYVDFDIEFGKRRGDRVVGRVMHIDRFGNAITNIEGKTILKYIKYGKDVTISIDDVVYRMPFVKSYGFVERGKILLTIGGSGFLEISKNWGDASEELRIRVGSAISLSL